MLSCKKRKFAKVQQVRDNPSGSLPSPPPSQRGGGGRDDDLLKQDLPYDGWTGQKDQFFKFPLLDHTCHIQQPANRFKFSITSTPWLVLFVFAIVERFLHSRYRRLLFNIHVCIYHCVRGLLGY